MISMRLILWWLCIVLFFALATNTLVQEEAEEEDVMSEMPMLSTNEISEDFVFDGMFNLDEWNAGTDSIADLITIDPEEGGVPEAPTVIKVFTNPNDVLVIAEGSEAELDAKQLKYLAPGIGNVRVGWKAEGEQIQEVLELVKINKLSPEEIVQVREKAMELENNAYEQSKDVYGLTSPMEVRGIAVTNLIK